MRIYKAKDYADMSRKAANIVSAQVIMKPNCVLGLATGSTPIGLYKQLVEWFRKGDLDFSEVMTVMPISLSTTMVSQPFYATCSTSTRYLPTKLSAGGRMAVSQMLPTISSIRVMLL